MTTMVHVSRLAFAQSETDGCIVKVSLFSFAALSFSFKMVFLCDYGREEMKTQKHVTEALHSPSLMFELHLMKCSPLSRAR